MRGEILGVERRRFWRDEDKLEIVMSVGIDGATVTQVAQRHEVTRQQIYAWRHELKKKGLWSPDNPHHAGLGAGSSRWVAKLWRRVCSVAAFLMPAMCLAEVNARFNWRGDSGLILGLPGNSHPSGRDSHQ